MTIRNEIFSLIVLLLFVSYCCAQTDESITITTYYPSPYGSYNTLTTRRLVVGDDIEPTQDGVVNFQGLTSNPAFVDDGTLYYNSTDKHFKYYNSNTNQWENVRGVLETVTGFRDYTGTIYAISGEVNDFVAVGTPGSGTWGIKCNTNRGWVRTGCSIATPGRIGAGDDLDLGSTSDGCVTDDEEFAAKAKVYITCARIE